MPEPQSDMRLSSTIDYLRPSRHSSRLGQSRPGISTSWQNGAHSVAPLVLLSSGYNCDAPRAITDFDTAQFFARFQIDN